MEKSIILPEARFVKGSKNKYLLVLIISLTIAIPFCCKAFSLGEFFEDMKDRFSRKANEVDIVNEVNVSANTGGNVVSDGEVIEGESKSEIHIKNIINGTEIDPVDIETDASEVKVESEIEVEDGKAIIQREIQIDSETETENYEVDLGSSTLGNDEEKQNILKESLEAWQEFWNNFLAGLQSFFQNLFNL